MMQPNKSLSEMRFFDHGGTMAEIYPAESKFAAQHKRLVRMLTVVAYLLCVSLVAILLSLYYLFLWNPDMNKDLPDIQSRFAGELCSSTQQHVQSHQHAQYAHRIQQQPAVTSSTAVNNNQKVTSADVGNERVVSDGSSKIMGTPKRAFVPYPAAVFGGQPGFLPLAPELLNPLAALTPLGASQIGPLKGPLDLSLNPPAHDINADLQTLSQTASADSSLAISSSSSASVQHSQQQPTSSDQHLPSGTPAGAAVATGVQQVATAPGSSTESFVYDDSKRSSSNSQEGLEISSSQEILTYQDGSALNSSNVSSSEY